MLRPPAQPFTEPIRHVLSGLLLVLVTGLLAPAAAQSITVQNGGTIEVTSGGVWNLHGSTLDLGGTGSTASIAETSGGRFASGMLTVTRTLSSPSQANPGGLGAEISSGAVLGPTTITRGHTVQTGSGNTSVARYYDVTPTTNTGLNATLSFAYSDAELNGLSENRLEFFRSTDGGSTWTERGQDGRDTNANTVTLSGIESLSRWTLGSMDSPLPVELAGFDAQLGDEGVTLRWRTASETNNAGFDVQRSTNGGTSFTTVGFVDGSGTTSEPHTYRFQDTNVPYSADSLTYRLRQVDVDGTGHLSRSMTVGRNRPDRVRLRAVYPNPARQTASIRYEVPSVTTVTLRVYDLLGREVATLVAGDAEGGRHVQQVDVSGLAPGTYLVRLTAEGRSQTRRLVVVR